MRRIAITALLAFAALVPWDNTKAQEAGSETVTPRVIIALLDDEKAAPLRHSRMHQMATMPLEHLGLVVEYHYLSDPLPDLSDRPDVRGVLTWFGSTENSGAIELLEWLEDALDQGKKAAVLGEFAFGFEVSPGLGPPTNARVNRFTRRLGVKITGGYVPHPIDAAYTLRDPRVWGFEQIPIPPPPFPVHTVIGADAQVHLQVGWHGADGIRSDVVVTNPNGGFAVAEFVSEVDPAASIRRWRINPFEFFRTAFATDDLPKPDTTTLSGRRIFYSHVDGDGWRSISEVEINDQPASAARVLLERIVKRNPELPVTIAPIAAEIDPSWIDDEESRRVVKEIMALPHVEAGSHTYSHPFQWSFFETYDAALERRIVSSLGLRETSDQNYGAIGTEWPINAVETAPPAVGGRSEVVVNTRYQIPRAFYVEPFDLDLEIRGSIDKIAEVGGKPVTVVQWSGDTTPFEAAVAAVEDARVVNINGGDTRFDSDYRSYGFVAPIGVPVGQERQIYSSMSNENTYTDLWSARFFGYRHLIQTINRTDLPIRVKPINVYYHTYSAEKVASLNALIEVLQDVQSREVTPLTTSEFVQIANGFYSTKIISLGKRRWRIEDRGSLQTIRFDNASLTTVDFSRSNGVIGERPLHGSLYVALDPSVETPVIALSDRTDALDPAAASFPYVRDSRWPVEGIFMAGNMATVTLRGFGSLDATWIMPEPGSWRVRGLQNGDRSLDVRFTVGDDRRLELDTSRTKGLRPMTSTTLTFQRMPD
jgi:hypothetical protein